MLLAEGLYSVYFYFNFKDGYTRSTIVHFKFSPEKQNKNLLVFLFEKLIIFNYGFSVKMTCGFTQQKERMKWQNLSGLKIDKQQFIFLIAAQVK